MTDLSSCVHAPFGVSPHFAVERSLRQGCRFAPLFFVILVDALHDGLEVNPFTGARVGLMQNTCRRHQRVGQFMHPPRMLYFMRFNLMQLHHSKCEPVGRGADCAPVTEAAVAAAGIATGGHALIPLAHSTPIRYLGVHCCFDGDWSAQHRKLLATI
jgi:hypothetical protein